MGFEKFLGKKYQGEIKKKINNNSNISAILTKTNGEITKIIEPKDCSIQKQKPKK